MRTARLYLILPVVLWLLLPGRGTAQTVNAQPGATPEEGRSQLVLPDLNVLLDSALAHSPLLKANRLEQEQIREELIKIRKNWIEYLYLEGSGRYGRFNLLTLSESTAVQSTPYGLLSSNEQGSYYGGVSLKIPLSAVSQKQNDRNIARLDLERAGLQGEQLALDIRQVIISEYYVLKSLKEKTGINLEVLQTIEINYLKAQRDLENNRIDYAEFSRIAESWGKSKNEYSQSVHDFHAQYRILENLAGLSRKSF
ncbi:MAG: TolC family protein [Bacteroidales bacterium]